VIDSQFDDNHAQATGKTSRACEFYGFGGGGGDTIISGSTFTNTPRATAARWEASTAAHHHQHDVQRQLRDRHRRQPGNGGCARAIYMDGTHEPRRLCGVTIANSTAVCDRRRRVPRVERSHRLVRDGQDDGRQQPGDRDDHGQRRRALPRRPRAHDHEQHDLAHQAFYNGGTGSNTCTVTMTNTTIAENTASGSNGGGMWLATRRPERS